MAIRVGILTISDRSSQGIREDISGPVLEKIVEKAGWEIFRSHVIPDEVAEIQKVLVEWADSKNVDLILTTGGTGFAIRDVTPEATIKIIDRQAPGIAEAMRQASLKITPFAMLSRAIAGIRGKTIIVNLPGSPKGAEENLNVILPVLPHAISLLHDSQGRNLDSHNHPTSLLD